MYCLSPLLVMLVIIVVYLFLGCIMDSLSMLLLTIPVFFPIVMGMDFRGLDHEGKAIWFGIIPFLARTCGGLRWSFSCLRSR